MGTGLQRASSTTRVFSFSGERRDELVVNAFGDDQARGRGAALAGREEAGIGGGFDGNREVGVIKNDHRVLAAHFQLELTVMFDRGGGDAFSRASRAGKRDGGEVGTVEHRLTNDRALAHDEVQNALRQAGAR